MSQRAKNALFNEAQILQLAANQDKVLATEIARGCIDGCFNAIIRFDGPEKAAEFAYALGDRAAGSVKVTPWPPSSLVEKIDMPASALAIDEAAIRPFASPPVPAVSRRDRLVAWLWWWVS